MAVPIFVAKHSTKSSSGRFLLKRDKMQFALRGVQPKRELQLKEKNRVATIKLQQSTNDIYPGKERKDGTDNFYVFIGAENSNCDRRRKRTLL